MQNGRDTVRLRAPRAENIRHGDAAAVVIGVQLETPQQTPVGLRWEVYAEGEREPLRYGLCLARPEEAHAVRVPVLHLARNTAYRYRFVLDEQRVAGGRFSTGQARSAGLAA